MIKLSVHQYILSKQNRKKNKHAHSQKQRNNFCFLRTISFDYFRFKVMHLNILLLLLLIDVQNSQTRLDNVYKLHRYLLNSSYDKYIRPSLNGEATVVQVLPRLYSINKMVPSFQKRQFFVDNCSLLESFQDEANEQLDILLWTNSVGKMNSFLYRFNFKDNHFVTGILR